MLATTTVQLCARQAPLAVGLLLRGPRAVAAARLAPLGRRAAHSARGAAVATAALGQAEYRILEYDYTRASAISGGWQLLLLAL